MEVIRDTWRTYFINVNTGVTSDITPVLEAGLLDKIASKGWDCQRPQVDLSQWTKPHLAFLKLTTLCGKHRGRSNEELFPYTDSVLFDTEKGGIVERCMDCEEKKALKVFEKYFRTTLPTPTPTPEETPVIQ
jgi:hypothetical protein